MNSKKIFFIWSIVFVFFLLVQFKAESFVEDPTKDKNKLTPATIKAQGFNAKNHFRLNQPKSKENEIIVKFRSQNELESQSASLKSKAQKALASQIKPKLSGQLQAKIHQRANFRLQGKEILEVQELPQKIKSMISDQSTLEPVFKGLHRKMQRQGKSEMTLNIEECQKLSKERKLPVSVKQNFNMANVYILKNEDIQGKSLEQVCKELSQDPNIEYVEPNYKYQVQMIPNDPFYSSSNTWGQGYDDLWGIKKIQADQAWDVSQGEGVVVAVIDTGVDYPHEDLAQNIWTNPKEIPGNGIDDDGNGFVDDTQGWDFANNDNDPMDDMGHGTHCCGTIAAVGNNGIGVVGVAPKTRIMPVKGLDKNGGGYSNQLADGICYAADQKANVLSNSWGGAGDSKMIHDAIQYAYSRGCVIVAAAGNENADALYFLPACYDEVITVGSSDHLDKKSDFSNYGTKIDVMAPGGESGSDASTPNRLCRNILSLRAQNTDMYGDGIGIVKNQYYRSRGTSMACPHAAGLAALILSLHPNYTSEQVRRAMRISADDIETPGIDEKSGYGRINAKKALEIEPVNITKELTSPREAFMDLRKLNEMIFTGTANADHFLSYSLEYRPYRSSVWTPISNASSPVINGELGRFNSTQLKNISDGSYVIRLSITENQYHYIESVSKTYFFYRSMNDNEFTVPGYLLSVEPLITDIDGDGSPDIILGSNVNDDLSLIFAYKSDGTLIKGWPIEIKDKMPFFMNFSAGDINHDQKSELIVTVNGMGLSLYCFSSDGKLLPNWPKILEEIGPFFVDTNGVNQRQKKDPQGTGLPVPSLILT